jgi:hypothetical protein
VICNGLAQIPSVDPIPLRLPFVTSKIGRFKISPNKSYAYPQGSCPIRSKATHENYRVGSRFAHLTVTQKANLDISLGIEFQAGCRLRRGGLYNSRCEEAQAAPPYLRHANLGSGRFRSLSSFTFLSYHEKRSSGASCLNCSTHLLHVFFTIPGNSRSFPQFTFPPKSIR